MARFFKGQDRTTDQELEIKIENFEEQQQKAKEYKHQLESYIKAITKFHGASEQFFGFIKTLCDSNWTGRNSLLQVCQDNDIEWKSFIRQIHTDADDHMDMKPFTLHKAKIDEQRKIQNAYDKARRAHTASTKQENQTKMDQRRVEMENSKEDYTKINQELHLELPEFYSNRQKFYVQSFKRLYTCHSKLYKNLAKQTEEFIRKIDGDDKKEDKTEYITSTHYKQDPSYANKPARMPKSVTTASNALLYAIPKDVRTVEQPALNKRKIHKQPKVLYRVKVMYDCAAENDDELDLRKDEFIDVIESPEGSDLTREQGWEIGKKMDGKIGIFPMNFTARLYVNSENE
ncbi:unnamed protein product [Didymodactylos carnosus]|uniref:SH3 domain-containing protein n=1 Tax=Didymodactylos carnosus TaxID=1234261 RepID=A0A814IZC0_9BILA|nr:unnamed protein product [Didymodactylos carnosus]CAF1051437.1 unnamed protein product [Didymodactylos carnosus]CAF3800774.1 unnamed protein product [Didymodactylos carnosus]CAF3818183.1 unnamed protein product [Didymodactylos carnosus]